MLHKFLMWFSQKLSFFGSCNVWIPVTSFSPSAEYITLDYKSMINLKPKQYFCSCAITMETRSAEVPILAVICGCSPQIRWVWRLCSNERVILPCKKERCHPSRWQRAQANRRSCRRLKHVHPWQNSQTRKIKKSASLLRWRRFTATGLAPAQNSRQQWTKEENVYTSIATIWTKREVKFYSHSSLSRHHIWMHTTAHTENKAIICEVPLDCLIFPIFRITPAITVFRVVD